jgi:hypothetical protein
MSAKIICFLVMVIAFFSFYQQSPLFTLGIIFVVIVGFIAYKRRKGKRKSMGSMISGSHLRSNKFEKILSLLMVQQLMNKEPVNHSPSYRSDSTDGYTLPEMDNKEEDLGIGLDVKQMIFDLLEEE